MNYLKNRILNIRDPFYIMSIAIQTLNESPKQQRFYMPLTTSDVYYGVNFERRIIQDINESEKELLIITNFFSEHIFEACCSAYLNGISVFIIMDKTAIDKIGGVNALVGFIEKYIPKDNSIWKLIKLKTAAFLAFSISVCLFTYLYLSVRWNSIYDMYTFMFAVFFGTVFFSLIHRINNIQRQKKKKKVELSSVSDEHTSIKLKLWDSKSESGKAKLQNLYLIDGMLGYVEMLTTSHDNDSNLQKIMRRVTKHDLIEIVSKYFQNVYLFQNDMRTIFSRNKVKC